MRSYNCLRGWQRQFANYQQCTLKPYRWQRNRRRPVTVSVMSAWLGLFLLLLVQPSLAATLNPADPVWGPLTRFVLSLFTGDPAIIAALSAFFMGLIFAIKTQHKLKSILGGLMIAVALQLGPSLVEHLSGAVLPVQMNTASYIKSGKQFWVTSPGMAARVPV